MSEPVYPIQEIYAWVIDDPTCKLGIIGMMPLNGMPMQAISSRRDLIENPTFRAFADSVAKSTGFAVKLQRFVLADTVIQTDPL